MSSITKMQVSGIRSFNPDKKEYIEFFFPLTLILGPNGTGKTTIIECLKYITTGDMPPNASKDGAFVHDPKVHHSTEVKAQVKLQFVDTQKKMCIATRSLQATQKAKAVKCNTLDSTIHRTGDSGETTTISNKCAEMNKEMISLLGVSKAILENVIFVHQEEANWPLSEGKTLKEKFDAIFASTRYVKALEKIRACRGTLATNITMYRTETKYLEQCKDKAEEIGDSLAKVEGKYVASRESVENIKRKLVPIENKLDQLTSKTGDVTKLYTKIEKLKSTKEEMEQNCQELQKEIENEFEGPTDELKRTLSEFDSKVKDMKDNLSKLENKLEKLEQESAKYGREKAKLLLEQGKLEQEAKRHQETMKKRDNKVRQTAEECSITGYAGPITDDHIMTFVNELKEVAGQVLRKGKEKKEKFEEKERGLQMEIDKQRDERTKLDTQCKMKFDRMQKSKEEIRTINRQLSQILSSGERLKEVERDLRSSTQELEEVKTAVDVDSLKTEVTQLQKEKVEFDAQLKNLDSEMSRISAESTARTQLDMYKKDKTSKEEQIQRLRNRNEDTLKLILGAVPSQNMKRSVDEFINKQSRSLRAETESLNKLRAVLTKLETTKKMEMDALNKKEDEFRVNNQKIADVCDGEDFDRGLEEVQVKMKKAETDRGYLKAVDRVFSRYLSELETNARCPLCHRGWGDDSQIAVHDLTSDIEDKINMVPDKLITAEGELKKYKTKYEAMLSLTSVREAVTDLSEKDIPNLKAKIRALSDQIESTRAEIEEKIDAVEASQTDEATGKSILPDMTMIDRYLTELKDLDRKIAQQASKLSGGEHCRTLQKVQTEREDIQLQLESINRNLDRKREKISQHTEKLQQLKNLVHELKSDKLQIETELQKRTSLEENKEDLEATIVTLEMEINEAKSQRDPIQDQIEKLISEKDEVVNQKNVQFDKDKDKFSTIKDHCKEINACQKEIEKYIHDGKAEQLEDSLQRKLQVENKQCDIDLQRDDLTEQINQTRDDLSSQQLRNRELSDNLLLRKRRKEVEMKEREIGEQEEKLGGLDVTNLNREMRELKTQQEEFMSDKNRVLGRQRGFEDEIMRYKKELNEAMYKDADVKYRDKLYDLKTTELAKDDLEKYYEALNSTIMTFHHQKMSEINKIIRELWRNTYKGNDIETIEIRTEGETVQDLDKRRNYSYRVVMIKGDAVIDMRGRCSAGQKVLASLIIRLALAETFCLNCGILALDEPTTNLDRENIESLAFALVEIIKGRERQKNFQLVVITHDEDFVELLGRSEYVDQFYRVKKDVHGCSKLEKSRVDQLHLR